MRKMLAILLIVGILVSGTLSIVAEVSEESPCEDTDFTDEYIDSFGDPAPCEGGGNGGGDVPG